MPAIWIIGLVTFCNYVFTLSLYYFTPYRTSILGVGVTLGAILAACKRFLCPVSNVGGGYRADKVATRSLLAGVLTDGYPGITGYRHYFSFPIVMLLLGAGVVLVWNCFLKKSQNK